MNNALLSEAGVKQPVAATRAKRTDLILGLLVIVAYWCQLFYQLQVEWTANDQYGYGWFVPLLAAVLLWRRWVERGEAEDGGRRTEDGGESSVISHQSSVVRGLWSVVLGPGSVVLLLFLLLPLRIIQEANVGWRSAQWLHALILVALTLILLWQAGGWRWVRDFGFPVLFLLVAVPWPMRIEQYFVEDLMRLVTAVTVEVVGVFGVPAIQRGNLLEIGSGVVSVDGACSGVRSLQSSLMIALFLGELYRHRYWERLVLIPASLLIAFVANVGRTSFLTWTAARLGLVRMESLHDSASLAVVAIVFGLLWLTARLVARQSLTTDHGPRTTDHAPLSAVVPPSLQASESKVQCPKSEVQGSGLGVESSMLDVGCSKSDVRCLSDFSPQLSPFIPANGHRLLITDHRSLFTFPYLLSALAWLLCIEAAAAVWFRIGDKRAETNPNWTINWPTAAPGYQEAQLPKVASDMLRYDTAKSVAWRDEVGNWWGFLALRWGPDNKNSFIGRGHTPDICFAGAGWKLVSEPAPVRLTVNGLDLPLRRYLFEVDGRTAYVFLALWDERSPGGRQETPFAYGIALRLKAAAQGKRHQGLKKLEISVIGPNSPEEALEVLQKGLEKLITTAKAEG
ncbi:MAG: exosortase/archaeosortase family protein [Verrucomicrobia bacterium]|nr:exosortase/archaeosortase family protein [Verrucomicrobiota bacterium]